MILLRFATHLLVFSVEKSAEITREESNINKAERRSSSFRFIFFGSSRFTFKKGGLNYRAITLSIIRIVLIGFPSL